MKRTALFEEHQKLGGRLIDFGGWELPVQYTGVMDEHLACRQAAGLFDVSHMGEVHIEGPDAEAYLNTLVTNQVAKLSVGQAQYTVMCHESGGIVDDLVIYRRAKDRFLVVVNASNTDKDFAHMQKVWAESSGSSSRWPNMTLTNESQRYTQIAIQGRKALQILKGITDAPVAETKTYWFCEGHVLMNIPAILGRTGYTGEDGFELYVPWNNGPEVWNALMKAGEPEGLKACGLGARDTLRLEMKYPLYGHELSDSTHPLEAGLGWVVKLDKEDFLGKHALVAAKERGIRRTLVGFTLLSRGIPRQGYAISNEDGTQVIGEVTSGTQSPSLNQPIGVGYVEKSNAAVGTRLTIDIRGNKIPAEVVPTPFYKRPY